MKAWYMDNDVNVEFGQKVTVFKCGGGRTTFGETAELTGVMAQHLIFTTQSGAVLKTKKDNLHSAIGKAQNEGYNVSLRAFPDFKNMIHTSTCYWNANTMKFETKEKPRAKIPHALGSV